MPVLSPLPLPCLPCLLQNLNVYSLTHNPGWDPFCTLMFVWEILQILSKWPASLRCLSGCVSAERISLETVLQSSWIPPSCKTDFLLHLPESLSLERHLIIPKPLARKSQKCLCKLGRRWGFSGLPPHAERREAALLRHLQGTGHCFWLFVLISTL